MSDRPSGRQIDYALALGITLWPDIGRAELSELLDQAKAALSAPPAREQFALATSLCIQIPADRDTRRKCTSFLYEYMAARRWVYSVIRHVAGAKWRYHAQSGLPEEWAARIAVALAHDPAMFTNVVNMATGNSQTGADVWTRMSQTLCKSPEYHFVCNFELPDAIVARIRQATTEPGTYAPPPRAAKRRQQSGCGLMLALLLALGASAVWAV